MSTPEREAIDSAAARLRRIVGRIPQHSTECDETYAAVLEYEEANPFEDVTTAGELSRLALAFMGSACEACDMGDL